MPANKFPPSVQHLLMAFFSQKGHKVKRSHSTERTKPHPTTSITSRQSLPTRTRTSSRPKTIYDPHPTGANAMHRPDHSSKLPPTVSKSNTAVPSTPRYSLRRVPVPSLSTQEDLDGLPYDRSSPISPSSRSTSISGKSSIADPPGGAYTNAAPAPKMKFDHLKSIGDGTGTVLQTPPHSPAHHHWESSSGCSRNPGIACDPEKTVSPISDLAVLVSSPKQLIASPLPSPKPLPQKPQRAVLRRKSNAKQPKPLPNNQSLTQKKLKPDLSGITSVATTPKRAPSSAHHPSTPLSSDAAHRVSQSTSDERDPRSTENLLSSSSPSLRDLTPAGAVVAAYKEQEMRRKFSKDSVLANADRLSYTRDSCGEIGGVYYTVFGSSGEVATVGKPEDPNRSNPDLTTCVSTKPKDVSRKPSLGPLGRLSRKSSTKAKKNGFMSESESGHERVTRDEQVRRSSFQGRRSTSVPAKHRRKKSLGIPVEDPDVATVWDPQSQTASTPSKSATGFVDEPSPSAGGKIWKLMKRLSTGGLRDKYQAQEATPPVPALPEGVFQTPPKSRPKTQSVPPSPNDSKLQTSRYVRGRSSFGDAALMNRNTSIRGFPSPVPSSQPPASGSGKNPSRRRQSVNTRPPSPVSSDIPPFKHWQKSRSSSVSTLDVVPPLPGRILSERILSPSELSKLEQDQARAELPSPPSTVDSHYSPAASTPNHHGNTIIITRNPSFRGLPMQAGSEDSETDGMSASEFAALPTPPRHHYRPNPHAVYQQSNGSNSVVGSVSTSPTIPMFSTQDVVNRFHSAKGGATGISRSLTSPSTPQSPTMSSDEFGLVSLVQPPPRPRRSDRRKPLVVDQLITTRASSDRDGSHRRKAPPSISESLPRERTLGLSSGPDGGEGGSYGTFGNSQSKGLVEFVKTSRDSSPSPEDLTFSPSIHSRSPLRFREVGSEEGGGKDRKVLTEKEKADRWHDLLERSDRAGGTIHIGNAKLPSDSLRFSEYSTLATVAL